MQEELNRLRTKKINGLIVRSRLQHFESNEKSTKCFLDHCKYNYKKNTIRQLLIDDKITNDEYEILELAKHYERLYRAKTYG